MTLRLYGIKNCDTMKKARVWLDAHGLAYFFHDYRVDGVDEATLSRWCAAVGWQTVLNRAGTTFRALPEVEKADLTGEAAIGLMLRLPAMIKRPVLEGSAPKGQAVLLFGFSPPSYTAALL